MKPVETIINRLRVAMTDARQNESHFESWMILNEAICDAIDALAEQPAQQEQNRQIDQLIQERDHRDEIIDKLCDAVLGPDRYEWSSQYFFEDAVREVEERMAEQPAQRTWVGLTDEDLAECDESEYKAARYWETTLKEKNT